LPIAVGILSSMQSCWTGRHDPTGHSASAIRGRRRFRGGRWRPRPGPRRSAVAPPVRYFRSGLPKCRPPRDASTGAPRLGRERSHPPAGSWNEQRPPAGEVRRRAHRRRHGRYGAAPFAVALGLRLRNAPAVGVWPLPISVMPPASLLPLSGMGSVCRTLGRVASDLAPKLGHIGEDVSLPPQFVGDHRRPD
jgi:hypothetical protein